MLTSPVRASTYRRGKVWVFYHYLYPDDVVSAVHMDQLCEGFVTRGWDVTGFPCNRGCRQEELTYPADDEHLGVRLRRIWRPRFRQASTVGRLLNAAWMIAAWSLLAFDAETPDAIVIGTDPVLSVLTALVWKRVNPQVRIVHWCFDLYPEAAYADGVLRDGGWISRLLTPLLKKAYGDCDAVVDLGPCMRERLAHYESNAEVATVVPWALEEPGSALPVAREEREDVCAHVRLALLYSGSFGRAHNYENFVALAQALRGQSASLTFSVRGNRVEELRTYIAALPLGSTCAIRFASFASTDRLVDRLAAPDVHLLSLEPTWTGLVIPSKFFGALAVGRPVLFSGGRDSSIAEWILKFDLGWVLTEENVEVTAEDLLRYVADPERVAAMQQRCLAIYEREFSRATGMNRMVHLLAGE